MPKSGFTIPPKLAEALDKPELKVFDDFMEIMFRLIEGVGEGETGELDNDNIADYHGGATGGHENLQQSSDVGDAITSSVEVIGEAAVAYDAVTRQLINDNRDAINDLVAAFNAFVEKFNAKTANEKTANQIV